MKILIITQKVDENDDILGFFVNWIKALATRAEKVEVICLAKGENSLPSNTSVYSLGKEKKSPKLIQAVRFYYLAFKLLRKTDGVFVHMAPEYVRALYPLNIFFRRPIIMWYAHIKVSRVAKWAINRVNYVFTPSKESFEFDSPKVVSTGHGIDAEIFKLRKTDHLGDVISISRISKVKRIETLIDAAWYLKQKNINVKINIYGQPARQEDHQYLLGLKKRIKDKKVEEYINWAGSVANKNAPEVYSGHRIFVRMQGGGGFGKTELEALACEIPIIVSTEVYKEDLQEFGEELYFSEDDAESLAEKIVGVLTWNKDKLDTFKSVARKLVTKKHNINNVASMVISYLRNAKM